MKILVEDKSGFNLESFGGIEIYRPRYSGEVKLRIESEFHLRSKFSSGIYSEWQDINKILLHQFEFYSKKFEYTIPKLASRYFMEFVLFEFDRASLIEEKDKYGQLSRQEADKWQQVGPGFRRAAKYLVERVALLHPEEVPDAPEGSLTEILDQNDRVMLSELFQHERQTDMSANDSSNTSRTNWAALEAMTDEEIDYSAIPPLTEEFFEKATLRVPATQVNNLIQLDPDVMAWFQSQGAEYKTLINSVLRHHIENNGERQAS